MNKEELLQELSVKLNNGEISRDEIANRFNLQGASSVERVETVKKPWQFSTTKALYALGAAIVIIGVVIFVGQIWDDVGSFGRISVTLGLGILMAAIGSFFLKKKPHYLIGSIFHLIGGVLISSGVAVALFEFRVDGDWTIALVFGLVSVFYLLLTIAHKQAILTFFAIANGTATIYLVLNAIVGSPFRANGIREIYQYITMVIGVSYLLLGYSFHGSWNKHLTGILYFLGSLAFLGSAFSQVFDSSAWRLSYVLLVIGVVLLSVYLRSRGILAVSTIFLIAYVSYITSKYFANSLGWPISLVILGFVFIGLGYISIAINKKYIKNV